MGYLIATAFWIFAIWLIRRDTKARGGVPTTVWIPTVWAFILLSRPLSLWLGFGGGTDSLEGSPLDRAFYFGTIIVALCVLSRRNVDWGQMVSRNWPIFLFYGFFLISVLWADSPISSFKRWFKDLGNVWIAALILTEPRPLDAFRAVFVRCAYVLIPLSEIFIRYFPSLGRYYTHSGGLEITGVTTQKNSLGVTTMICGLVLIWDWFERTRSGSKRMPRFDRYLPFAILVFAAYMLYLSDSATSMFCMLLGTVVLSAIKVPFLRKRIGVLGSYILIGVLGFFILDSLVGGLKEAVVGGLGRDMTFTGRTDVWRELLNLHTDPILGTGFCDIWSDDRYCSKLPYWVAFSAHNGYLETYLDGGYCGIIVLAILLVVTFWRHNRQLRAGNDYSLIRFTILLLIIIGSFSESHFARMGPLWFIFLLTALEVPRHRRAARSSVPTSFSEAVPLGKVREIPVLQFSPA